MPTQQYAQQQQVTPRVPKFVPGVGVREVIAIEAMPGRLVNSNFGPTEVAFSLSDGRIWYVPQVVADEIYRMQIAPHDQIEVTGTGKKKTDVLIVRVQPNLGVGGAVAPSPPSHNFNNGPGTPAGPPFTPEAPVVTPASAKLMGCLKVAIDAAVEAEAYATRRGLELRFSSEDIRTMANTLSIQGGTR